MTELIITQKAFSAAAKTVTTSDQMIQKAINLKRG
jgi:flagellar hook protein FlgE